MILLVSNTDALCALLQERGEVTHVTSPADALSFSATDVVVVNPPLADDPQLRLLDDFPEEIQVIVLLGAEDFAKHSLRLQERGVFALEKPIGKKVLLEAVRFAQVARARVTRIRDERETLRQKVDDLKRMSRAKGILIHHMGYTEPEAHRHIEQTAMERRLSKRELCERILATYEY